MKKESAANGASQVDKFRALARQLEADEDPAHFKEKLVKVAKAPRDKPKPK